MTPQDITRSQLVGALSSICVVLLLISAPGRSRDSEQRVEQESVNETTIPGNGTAGMVTLTGEAGNMLVPPRAHKAELTNEVHAVVDRTSVSPRPGPDKAVLAEVQGAGMNDSPGTTPPGIHVSRQ